MPLLSQIEIRAMQVQQEALRSARESVMEVLEVRFQEVPEAIADTINSIEDVVFLKQSHWQAIVMVPSFLAIELLNVAISSGGINIFVDLCLLTAIIN
ncbi:MAG: hypothetical protein GDA56_14565 [Hormoscilla sp. GM7CHS1pb]|nr:hypothetical protein [Hormoscilla sp. GM7CHS1pb]